MTSAGPGEASPAPAAATSGSPVIVFGTGGQAPAAKPKAAKPASAFKFDLPSFEFGRSSLPPPVSPTTGPSPVIFTSPKAKEGANGAATVPDVPAAPKRVPDATDALFPLSAFAASDPRARPQLRPEIESVFVDRQTVLSGTVPHYGWLGTTALADARASDVYMNTHAPFCLVAVGVQGAGKSHTLSCVIENCLLDSPRDIAGDAGMAAVVFYYDQSPDNFCEAVTLSRPRGDLPAGMARAVKNVVVLVSPANFKRRKRVYENLGFPVAVKPLLFSWDDLDAADLQTLMHVDEMPLYMESVIDYLRSMQKADAKPNFAQFRAHIAEMDFTNAQRSPLELRLQLLASFLREDPSNAAYYAGQPDVSAVLRTPDQMVVVDLTDPLFSGEQANGVFAVVMAKFLSCPAAHGRLCVFDEAHKYMRPAGTDGLSRAVVSAVRQMRHLGVRTVVSTQSPRTLPAELLELASAAVVHRFHSQDWFDVLRARLRLPVSFADGVLGLETGEALVFTLRWGGGLAAPGEFVRRVKVRPRLTWDGGASRVTQKKEKVQAVFV